VKPGPTGESADRWRALALLGLAELLAMSLWFSASAVTPALRSEWGLDEGEAGWLTTAVQLGFVAGTLLSALLNVPDVLSARRLFTVAAAAAAFVNALFGLAADGFASGVALRFLVGFFLAGGYPTGMRVAGKRLDLARISS
jgi:MFS family permease